MKKIFTLLFVVGAIGMASAQPVKTTISYHGTSNIVYSKKAEIQKINREYDFKIMSVITDRHVSRWEKSKEIRRLENRRDKEIAQVEFRFSRDQHGYADKGFDKRNAHKW